MDDREADKASPHGGAEVIDLMALLKRSLDAKKPVQAAREPRRAAARKRRAG